MITTEEFQKRIKEKLKNIEEMFNKKNAQYGERNNPIQNFTNGALLLFGDKYTNELQIHGAHETLKAYVAKHIIHIYNNDITGNKVDESIMDTVIYFLIDSVFHDLYMEGIEDELRESETGTFE